MTILKEERIWTENGINFNDATESVLKLFGYGQVNKVHIKKMKVKIWVEYEP